MLVCPFCCLPYIFLNIGHTLASAGEIIMDIKPALILDHKAPLSKALREIMDTGTAVIVTKGRKYYGIIDDRHLSSGISAPSKRTCDAEVVKPPVLSPDSGLGEQMNAFLLGHFKALPIVEKGKPKGITTRVDFLKQLLDEGIIPSMKVDDVMNHPVYTVSEDKTIGATKGLMKEYGVNRLIVTRRGFPIGVVSTFDLATWLTKPKKMPGKREFVVKEVRKVGEMPLSEYFRPEVTTLEVGKSIYDAVERMIEKKVSSLIVLKGKKPAGVVSAVDVFKLINKLAEVREEISISGLNEDTIIHYNNIKEKIQHVTDKFSESLKISDIRVHVKEKKSVYQMKVTLSTFRGLAAVSRESGSLKQTTDWVAAELNRVLERYKGMKRMKARGGSARPRRRRKR